MRYYSIFGTMLLCCFTEALIKQKPNPDRFLNQINNNKRVIARVSEGWKENKITPQTIPSWKQTNNNLFHQKERIRRIRRKADDPDWLENALRNVKHPIIYQKKLQNKIPQLQQVLMDVWRSLFAAAHAAKFNDSMDTVVTVRPSKLKEKTKNAKENGKRTRPQSNPLIGREMLKDQPKKMLASDNDTMDMLQKIKNLVSSNDQDNEKHQEMLTLPLPNFLTELKPRNINSVQGNKTFGDHPPMSGLNFNMNLPKKLPLVQSEKSRKSNSSDPNTVKALTPTKIEIETAEHIAEHSATETKKEHFKTTNIIASGRSNNQPNPESPQETEEDSDDTPSVSPEPDVIPENQFGFPHVPEPLEEPSLSENEEPGLESLQEMLEKDEFLPVNYQQNNQIPGVTKPNQNYAIPGSQSLSENAEPARRFESLQEMLQREEFSPVNYQQNNQSPDVIKRNQNYYRNNVMPRSQSSGRKVKPNSPVYPADVKNVQGVFPFQPIREQHNQPVSRKLNRRLKPQWLKPDQFKSPPLKNNKNFPAFPLKNSGTFENNEENTEDENSQNAFLRNSKFAQSEENYEHFQNSTKKNLKEVFEIIAKEHGYDKRNPNFKDLRNNWEKTIRLSGAIYNRDMPEYQKPDYERLKTFYVIGHQNSLYLNENLDKILKNANFSKAQDTFFEDNGVRYAQLFGSSFSPVSNDWLYKNRRNKIRI